MVWLSLGSVVIALGALTVSYRAYRIARRQGQVEWAASVQTRQAFPERPLTMSNKYVHIERKVGPTARQVSIKLLPDEHVHVLTGRTELDEMHPGAYEDFMVTGPYSSYPNQVIITWRGWFGRRRTWQSGL